MHLHHSSMSWEISLLLYFFSWNYIWFLQKEPTKVQNFRLLTAQVKFHQICTLIGYFCWKYITFQLKRYGGVMPHDTEECCKIWRKTDLWFGKWHEANFHQNIWKCQNWYFHGILLSKVENPWATNLQRSCSNLKRNWLVVSKLT